MVEIFFINTLNLVYVKTNKNYKFYVKLERFNSFIIYFNANEFLI